MAAIFLKFGLIFVVLVAVFTGAAVAQEEDLMSLLRVWEAAANRHDLDAMEAMFAADAEFELVGQVTLVGKEQIRSIHDYDAGLNTRLDNHDCVVEGNTVTCQVTEHNDWLDAAGISEVHYTSAVYTFEDGLIKRIEATLSPESGQAIGQALQAFDAWATENRPEEYAKLFNPEGRFIYSRESGVRVVGLLKEWRASVPTTLPVTGAGGPSETLALWLAGGGFVLLTLGVGLWQVFRLRRAG